MRTVAAACVALAVALGGCVGVAGTDPAGASASGESLPDGFRVERARDEVLAAFATSVCDVVVAACFDHAFTLPRGAVVLADLSWSEPHVRSHVALMANGEVLVQRAVAAGDPRTNVSLRASVHEAGEFVLRVYARDGFALDVALRELPRPVAPAGAPPAFGPHVVLGIPDTGINPYHEAFYRPHLTEHPCTYVRGFPCDVKELRLSVGEANLKDAVERDADAWASMERESWYWIPQTVFIAVRCGPPVPEVPGFGSLFGDVCVLDEGEGTWAGHGTGTTSIAIRENPDALVAFNEGADIQAFVDGGIPVDVYSVSWGSIPTMPLPRALMECPGSESAPLIVKAAGNDARVVPVDCQTANPQVIAAGGGFTAPRAHAAESASMTDVEGYWAPPWASRDAVTDVHPPGSWGGTSFATPTVAGALGKVVLELRRASGYDGGVTPGGFVDPVLGVSVVDVRNAMNLTASYAPAPKHAYVSPVTQVPLNEAAPWLQWGWGFFDGDVADATVAHLLGVEPAPEKPPAAHAHMQAVFEARRALYG